MQGGCHIHFRHICGVFNHSYDVDTPAVYPSSHWYHHHHICWILVFESKLKASVMAGHEGKNLCTKLLDTTELISTRHVCLSYPPE